MAGWVSIHRVADDASLRTAEQMVAATLPAVAEAGMDGPSHQVLGAAVADRRPVDAPR